MEAKGERDKGRREEQKKAKLNRKEERKQKRDKNKTIWENE